MGTTGTEAVSQGECHVVAGADVANIIEVLIEEALLLMHLAPLGDDAATTAHDTGQAVIGQMDILQTDAAVDREIVHALLALLNQRVAENLPVECLGLAVHLLEGLVERYGADGNGAVAQDPLSGLVNVVACGEIHQCVATPFAAPYRLLHLLLDAGSGRGVTDVGVDLHQEVGTDNHRLALGMLLVGRDDRTTGSHLLAHELRRDVCLDAELSRVHVLANRHIFHLLGDHSLLSEVELCLTRLTSVDPGLTQLGQTLFQVYFDVRVAISATGVVEIDGGIGLLSSFAFHEADRRCEVHSPHTHFQIRVDRTVEINLLRGRVAELYVVVHILFCIGFIFQFSCFMLRANELAHHDLRLLSLQDGTTDGDATHTQINQVGHILHRDASDGDQGQVDLLLPHLFENGSVPLQPQKRGEVFLGGREPEGATADVVRSLLGQSLHILEGVGGASNDLVGSQELAGLIHRHVLLAKVHTVRSDDRYHAHHIVENQGGFVVVTELTQSLPDHIDLGIVSALEAQLHPAAACLQDIFGLLREGDVVVIIGDKLNHGCI